MRRVRLIALDMDGTLLCSDHHTLPARNVEAIRAAHARGIRVTISTGRMVEDASDFIRRYDLPCMIIAADGARACSGAMPGAQMLYRCDMLPADAHAALDILLPSGLMVNGFEDGVVSTVNHDTGRRYHLAARGLIEDRYGEAAIRQAADRGIMKLFAVGDGQVGDAPDARVARLRAQLAGRLDHLQITSSGPGNVEIMPERAGKGAALAHLAQTLGLSRENVMAVGDSDNDLSMLAYAVHSVAMGNASPAVRARCRYVTDTTDACGVAKIIERVLVSQEGEDG